MVEGYRPITILSVLTKVQYLSRQLLHTLFIILNIYYASNSFVAKRSTSTNLSSFVEQLLSHVSSNKEVDVTNTDLSKAFDRVDHDIHLHKLKYQFYINGPILLWCSSYLKNRKMRVVVNGFSSDLCIPLSGVPQGSILGPIFFQHVHQ